jgi:hypothetical protein
MMENLFIGDDDEDAERVGEQPVAILGAESTSSFRRERQARRGGISSVYRNVGIVLE